MCPGSGCGWRPTAASAGPGSSPRSRPWSRAGRPLRPAPAPVRNLLRLAGVRAQATAVGLTEVVCFGGRARLTPVDDLPESKQVRLDRLYPGAIWKQTERTLVVPLPPAGTDLPTWLCELLTGVLGAPDAPALPDTTRPEHRRAASSHRIALAGYRTGGTLPE